MANGYSKFTKDAAGSPVAGCPPSSSSNWDQECVRKIFCQQDPDLVEDLAKVTTYNAKKLMKEVWKYDGKEWKLDRGPINGAAGPDDSGKMLIEMSADQNCESAAAFIYHEMWHIKQPPDMTVQERETEAYTKTEEWCLKHPPMTQGFQKTEDILDAAGKKIGEKKVVDHDAIKRHVEKNYPVPKKGDPEVVDHWTDPVFGTNWSKVKDPNTKETSWRVSKAGDKHAQGIGYDSDEELDASKWKCP